MTISEAMVLQKALRERVGELQSLRNKNAVRENIYYRLGNDSEEKKRTETEPQYDPKVVDKKVVEIEIALFKLSSAIKTANAITKIAFEANVDSLLTPIQ